MARTVSLQNAGGGTAAQPSPAPSGQGRRQRRRGVGSFVPDGDTRYLWALLAIEFVLTGWLRHWSRNHHGG
jgi:hypothetical protein